MMGIREYARHRAAKGLPGGDAKAVRVAIKEGRLSNSLSTNRKKIRGHKLADAEWAATTKSDYVPLSGPTAAGRSGPPGQATNGLAVARARRESAQAELREMELSERRGELVSAKDIEAHMANVFAQCRTRLLSIPARARQRDPSLTVQQLKLLEQLVHESLENLASEDLAIADPSRQTG